MAFFKRLRLFHKLAIIVIPFLVFAILLTNSILSLVNYSLNQMNILNNYNEIIRTSSGEIRQYMKGTLMGLEGLARVLSAMSPDPWQDDLALVAYLQTVQQFISICIVSPAGEVLTSTKIVGDHADFKHSNVFEKARAGLSAISNVILNEENVPFVHMGVPMFYRGRVSAVLWGELSIKAVWDVLEGIRIGETGSVFIVDSGGRFIAHREMDKVIDQEAPVEPSVLKRLMESEDVPFQWMEKRDNKSVYCLGYHIPSLEWIVILNQETWETQAYVSQSLAWAAMFTFFLCVLGAFIIWLLVRHFLAPLQALHLRVQRVGEGDIDHQVSVASEDEIGALSIAFNNMTTSLRAFIAREIEMARDLVQARNLAALGVTASKVAHEVGNLLGNIEFFIMRLKREELSPSGKELLLLLQDESDRVKTFIRAFLQFAKRPEPTLQRISLEEPLREIFARYSGEAGEREIRMEIVWPSDLPVIDVDEQLICHVLMNLVKNSLDAMTGPGLISMEGSKEDNHLVLAVKDTGPGIDPQTLEHLFEPFFTTKGKNGNGLGLAICRTIVEAHRGTIECRSTPGESTTFILKLPLQ